MDQAPEAANDRFQKHALAFDARRSGFARLLLINSLLALITLGIYRFWARTKVRRFLWRHVTFLDDPLEYTGTGGELFVGFLIVIAILFPLGLIYKAIGTVVPPDNQSLRVGLEITYYMVLLALLQIGFYRMWRYRMSRTTWRGVRFGLDGSTWAYLRLASGWTLLCALTLGAAYPWMKTDLWRYQIRHTRLGDQTFHFDGNARSVFMAWLPVFVCILCVLGIAAGGFAMLGMEEPVQLKHMSAEQKTILSWMIGGAFLTYVIGALAYFRYRVCQARLQISGLCLAETRFRSELRFARLLGFALLSLLLIIVAITAVSGILGVILYSSSGFIAHGISAAMGPMLISTWIIGFFTLMFIAPFIWSIVFSFELVKQTVITTSILNPHVLEQAAQTAATGPRTGEGLADALDIGGF
jgi:uncharacterized membrane protein YjgN (DUF898 family)